jgi:hypothetical protein
MVPLLCILVDLFITNKFNSKLVAKVSKIYLMFFAILITVMSIIYYFDLFNLAGAFGRVADALILDEDSPRQVQYRALTEGFYNYPILGSGFGGEVSDIRSVDRPWNFELTYSKLLFNVGVVGVVLIFILFLYYILKIFRMCRSNKKNHSINTSLLVGFFCVAIASASNPYINSFDFLFVLAILPLIINLTKKEMNFPRRPLMKSR